MSKQFRRNQRWRMNRNIQKRRVNLFFLEQDVKRLDKQVQHLEKVRELSIMDTENTYDLLNELEIKVNRLIARERAAKQLSLFERMWIGLFGMLGQKGNP